MFEIPSFVEILDFVGTFAFAISGIRLASAKSFDWFGAYVVQSNESVHTIRVSFSPASNVPPLYGVPIKDLAKNSNLSQFVL